MMTHTGSEVGKRVIRHVCQGAIRGGFYWSHAVPCHGIPSFVRRAVLSLFGAHRVLRASAYLVLIGP